MAGGPETAGVGELAAEPAGGDAAMLAGAAGALLAGALLAGALLEGALLAGVPLAGVLDCAAGVEPAAGGELDDVACGLELFVHPVNASATESATITDDHVAGRNNRDIFRE